MNTKKILNKIREFNKEFYKHIVLVIIFFILLFILPLRVETCYIKGGVFVVNKNSYFGGKPECCYLQEEKLTNETIMYFSEINMKCTDGNSRNVNLSSIKGTFWEKNIIK